MSSVTDQNNTRMRYSKRKSPAHGAGLLSKRVFIMSTGVLEYLYHFHAITLCQQVIHSPHTLVKLDTQTLHYVCGGRHGRCTGQRCYQREVNRSCTVQSCDSSIRYSA